MLGSKSVNVLKFVALLALAMLAPALAQDPVVVNLPVSGQWVDTGIDLHKGDSLSVVLRVPRGGAPATRPPIAATEVAVARPTMTGRIGEITFAANAHCAAPATGRFFLRLNPLAESFGEVETMRARISYVSRPSPTPTPIVTPTPLRSAFNPLPNLVGMKFRAAARVLRKYELTPQRQKRASSYRAGEVVDQSPAAGTDIRRIKTVILGVSDGSLSQLGNVTPTVKPVPPTVRPVPPTVRPAPPTVRPALPTRRPVLPTFRPAPPTLKPVPPTAKPPPTQKPTKPPPPTTTPPATASPSFPPPTPTATPITIAVPAVVGSAQKDAAVTIARAGLRAQYLGTEPSDLPAGSITRTRPVAGALLSRGALVGYWVASGPAPPAPDGNRWLLWLIAVPGVLSAALLGFSLNNRMRLAKATRSLLTVHPSLDPNGPTNFAGDVKMAGPTAHIQASVEMGEASFEGDGPTITREEHND